MIYLCTFSNLFDMMSLFPALESHNNLIPSSEKNQQAAQETSLLLKQPESSLQC